MVHVVAQHEHHGLEHQPVVIDGDHVLRGDPDHRRVHVQAAGHQPRADVAVGDDARQDRPARIRIGAHHQQRRHVVLGHALRGFAGRGRLRDRDGFALEQALYIGRQQAAVGLLAQHGLPQPGAVLDLDLVGKQFMRFEQFGEDRLGDQVKQGVFGSTRRETHTLAMQQAELAEISAFGDPVVERAVAPEDLDHTAAHDMPELRILAELHDRAAALEITHIHRLGQALQRGPVELAERLVTGQESQNLELFILHRHPCRGSLNADAARTPGP